jgi:hypothetical protein
MYNDLDITSVELGLLLGFGRKTVKALIAADRPLCLTEGCCREARSILDGYCSLICKPVELLSIQQRYERNKQIKKKAAIVPEL